MKRIALILIILASALQPGLGAGTGQYYFNNYQTQSGLPSNTIYRTVQDRLGFIWVSTRDGICRFDGHSFHLMGSNGGRPGPMVGMSPGLCADNDGCIWFANSMNAGCYDPMTGDILSIGKISSADINAICADKDSNIWFISTDLYRYSKATGELKKYPAEDCFQPQSGTTNIYGSFIVSSSEGQLYRYDEEHDTFNPMGVSGAKFIAGCSRGMLLISTPDNAVILYNPHTRESETIMGAGADGNGFSVLCIAERTEDEYWIGTEGGILVYDRKAGTRTWIRESPLDSHSISASYVMNLFSDRDGNIWAGTYYKGLNLWQNRRDSYNIFYDNSTADSMKGNIVRSIVSQDDRHIWIGTEDGELNCYDSQDGTFSRFPVKETFGNIQDVLIDSDQLWIATYGKGLFRYNPSSQTVTARYDISDNFVIRLLKTMDGDILAATHDGLYCKDRDGDSFELVEGSAGTFVHALYQDLLGYVWVGTYGHGLSVYSRHYRLLRTFTLQESGNGLLSNHITSIYEDSRRKLWVTTNGGLYYKDPQSYVKDFRFHCFSSHDGLPSNVVCSIAEDLDGMLWVSTSKGLVKLDPDTREFSSTYFKESQITGSQFSYGAAYRSGDGTVYMGTAEGMIVFNPAYIQRVEPDSELFITGIHSKDKYGEKNLVADGESPLTAKKVTVKSRDISSLEISFSSPNFSNILATRYEYRLKRGSRIDSGITPDNSVSFSRMVPGKYTFTVSKTGSDVPESTKEVTIKVKAPFYGCAAAIVFYALVLLSLITAALYLFGRKRTIERERRINEMENEKQKEIYDAKIKYFTNITHEIRTPLSLIKMPLDKIISSKGYSESSRDEIMTIQSNTNRLLELANQLLDLRKMEQNEKKLTFVSNDITAIVRKVCDYFTATAKERRIDFSISLPDKPVNAFCDADGIEKITANLLSNAIKYGKDRINVILTEDGSKVRITVSSNGEPITGADRERIFEPFFQARMSDQQVAGSKGTGLGLPFSRTLAEMHNGRLLLADTDDGLNTFVLEIPLIQPLEIISDDKSEDKAQASSTESDSSKPSLLIVEDDSEMKYYLGKELSEGYNTVLAGNGEEALKLLKEQRIDLVISDIMMPLMDGCELCNIIKTDVNFCHIPVILLTAAVGVETRIQTLKVGADGYIEKPFSIDLLRANIASLFKNKEIAFKQYTGSPLSPYKGTVINTVDNEFMERLHDAVMKNLADPELSTETLTSALGASKSTLYRKIKANTGLNINEYIRLCRLKEAAELLASHKYRINEVAYLVGFTSPSYFTSSFQKQFNVSPSAFIKNPTGE